MESRSDCRPWIGRDAVEWQAADMTAIIGADVRWDALGHETLWLAVDCGGRPKATIGELVEQNSTGPLRLGFGGWRDLLLGCQYHNGRGELITVGGRTVKNVAGYDLTKFMIGQRGVFGRVAAVAMRAYRKPDDALLAEFAADMALFNRLVVSPQRPQWAVLTADSLTCGYLGNQRTVDYYARELAAWKPRRVERHGLAGDVAWRCARWRVVDGEGMAMRASVPPMRISEFAKLAELRNWVADPGFGIVLAHASARAADSAGTVGGRAWFWDEEQELLGSAADEIERGILQRLKAALDPDDQLARLP
jgi:FAD/FMN-containing dehydrogenase